MFWRQGTKRDDPWDAVFADCDLEFARAEIISHFAGAIIPKAFAAALDAFASAPSRENAIRLIEINKDFAIAFFADNKRRMDMMREAGTYDGERVLSVNSLQNQTEFAALCESLGDDTRDRHLALVAAFQKMGYPLPMIQKAIAEAWTEMAKD